MSPNKTLYWTADSPFCRIVLWAFEEESAVALQRVHLSWQQLRDESAKSMLGVELTVPCLADGKHIESDSLRLLAQLNPREFQPWMVSADGALYRCAEGQLGRVMYALYDNLDPAKTRRLWLQSIQAVDRLWSFQPPAELSRTPSWGSMACHTFLSFCVALKPDWLAELPENLRLGLVELERSASFHKLRMAVQEHPHRVPCGLFSEPAAGG